MQSYGDSFGFRRSDEDLHSGAESNFKVPVAGSFLQGDLVEIDPASAGYVKKSSTDLPLVAGVRGLLIQQGQLLVSPGLTRNVIFNTRDLSQVLNDAPAIIVTGSGLKVWVKNLASVAAGTGRRAYSAETRVDLTGIALGDHVKWDGAKWVKTTTAGTVVGTVTKVTATGIEFTLNDAGASVGPAGATGPTGPTGATGATGPTGP